MIRYKCRSFLLSCNSSFGKDEYKWDIDCYGIIQLTVAPDATPEEVARYIRCITVEMSPKQSSFSNVAASAGRTNEDNNVTIDDVRADLFGFPIELECPCCQNKLSNLSQFFRHMKNVHPLYRRERFEVALKVCSAYRETLYSPSKLACLSIIENEFEEQLDWSEFPGGYSDNRPGPKSFKIKAQ